MKYDCSGTLLLGNTYKFPIFTFPWQHISDERRFSLGRMTLGEEMDGDVQCRTTSPALASVQTGL